jgi:hypothetical protein
MKVINADQLAKLFEYQARMADMWIIAWEKYKDPSSVRNAAMAIGKLFGIYSVLVNVNGGHENVPEHITEKMKHYNDIWENL